MKLFSIPIAMCLFSLTLACRAPAANAPNSHNPDAISGQEGSEAKPASPPSEPDKQISPLQYVQESELSWEDYSSYPDALMKVVRWKTLVGGSRIPRSDLQFGVMELAPHAVYPGHRHPAPELIYVIGGRGEWTADGERAIVEPGTAIYCPPNTTHRWVNLSDEVLQLVWVWWAPNGDERVLSVPSSLTQPVPAQQQGFPDSAEQ